MHFQSLCTLFALFSYALFAQALPLNPQNHDRQQGKQKRASYSVVAVDGGPATASGATATPSIARDHPTTVIQTVTKNTENTVTVTLAPNTQGPVTETVIATVTAPGSITTITPASSRETAIPATSTIEVNSLPTVVTVPLPLGHGPESIATSTTYTISTLSTATTTATTTMITSTSSSAFSEPISTATVSTIVPTSSCPEFASTTTTYDDGLWHTTYPAWNRTSTTMATTGILLPTGYRR